MDNPVANGWRGEGVVKCGEASIKLRCNMNALATIQDKLECDSLIEVFRKWDGLSPDAMENTLSLLAESPGEAAKFWVHVDGLRGLESCRSKFYEVVSGQTPEEVKAEDESRKKLAAFLAQKSDVEVAKIVEALNL